MKKKKIKIYIVLVVIQIYTRNAENPISPYFFIKNVFHFLHLLFKVKIMGLLNVFNWDVLYRSKYSISAYLCLEPIKLNEREIKYT